MRLIVGVSCVVGVVVLQLVLVFYLLYVFLLIWLNCYFDLFAFTVFALYVLVIFVVPPVFLSIRLLVVALYCFVFAL